MVRRKKNKINTQWQIPVPYGSMLHILPTNYHFLAAEQQPYQKAYLLMKKTEEFSGKKRQENGLVVGSKKTRQKKQLEQAEKQDEIVK